MEIKKWRKLSQKRENKRIADQEVAVQQLKKSVPLTNREEFWS